MLRNLSAELTQDSTRTHDHRRLFHLTSVPMMSLAVMIIVSNDDFPFRRRVDEVERILHADGKSCTLPNLPDANICEAPVSVHLFFAKTSRAFTAVGVLCQHLEEKGGEPLNQK